MARALFELDDSYARELPGLSVPWQAAPAPDAAAAGAQRGAGRRARRSTPPRCARPTGVGCWSGNVAARRRARRSRRPTPATSSAATRRGSATAGRCCSASCVDARGPASRPAPQGLGPHAVRPRRRRQGRGRPDAARVRDQRGDARARHPDHARARRRRHRRAGAARDGAARRGARPRRRQPPARRHVPVRRRDAATATLLRRLADYAIARHHPDAADAAQPLPRRCFDARRRRAGGAGRAVDARRLHPRRDEHRQHDDLRRDDRLRPVRVHGRLRPGDGVQLDRPRRPLRLRQPAARSRSGTWPGSPRRCCRCSTTTATRRSRRRRRCSDAFPDALRRGTGATGMRGEARAADGRRRRPRAGRRPAGAAARRSASTTRSFFRALSSPAGTATRARCSPTRRRSTRGPTRWRGARCAAPAAARPPTRWTGVNPVYIPRNHLRRGGARPRRPAATSSRSSGCSTSCRGRSTSAPASTLRRARARGLRPVRHLLRHLSVRHCDAPREQARRAPISGPESRGESRTAKMQPKKCSGHGRAAGGAGARLDAAARRGGRRDGGARP